MVLVKLKRRGLFVLVMFLVLIVQSCSFEYDRFVDEADSPQNAMTLSNGIEYDVVLQSREFEEYDSYIIDLDGIILKIYAVQRIIGVAQDPHGLVGALHKRIHPAGTP